MTVPGVLVSFAMMLMAMPPEHQLLEQEEKQNATQNHHEYAVDMTGMLEGMGKQIEKYGAQHRPDGIRHHDRNNARMRSQRYGERHHGAGQGAGQAHQDDPGQRG